MQQANVSYIMPVYNGEQYIAEAIDSLLAQTLPPIQIIIIDDGSTDGTAEIVARYGDRITSIHQTNAGQSAARNHGVRLAKTPFVAFLDADDLAHPQKLQCQLQRFNERPNLQLCDGYIRNFWSPELTPNQRSNDLQYLKPYPGSIITWLARRELFDTVGEFKQEMSFGEDTDWYLRVKDSGATVETLPDVLASRRLHLNNITRRNPEKRNDALVELIKARRDRIRKKT